MTTALLLEELLRYAYVLTLITVAKLVMAIGLLALVLVGARAAWPFSDRREFHCTPGPCVRPLQRCTDASGDSVLRRQAHGRG
jgi:hypothetical protein